MDIITIINFKERSSVKEAIRRAAVNSGHKNISEFLVKIVKENPLVAKELKKTLKKVA